MPALSTVSTAPEEPSALYCPLCDRYFLDEASCAVHIQHSSNHPQCEPCGLRFANGHYRRQVRLPYHIVLYPLIIRNVALVRLAATPLLRCL